MKGIVTKYTVFSAISAELRYRMRGRESLMTRRSKEKEAKDLGERSDKKKYYKVSFERKLGNSFPGWEELWFYI